MTADNTTGDATDTATLPSLEEELKRATADKDAAQSEQQSAAQSADAANDKLQKAIDTIKGLNAKLAVFGGVVNEYKAQAETWKTLEPVLSASIEAAAPIADAGMSKTVKEQVPKLVKASLDKMDASAKDCRSTEASLKKASEELDSLKARLERAQAELEDTKQAPKRLAAELKALSGLQAEIATLRDKGQFTALHLCLRELNHRKSTVTVDADKLGNDLLSSMREVDSLTAKLADKQGEVDRLTQALAAKKKADDDLKKNPRADILAQLEGKAS